MMQIKENKNGIEIEYTYKARRKERVGRLKNGIKQGINAVITTIPIDLIPLISEDQQYTYIYEHFETMCMTAQQPPEDITYKRMKLSAQSHGKRTSMIMEIPNKFFNTKKMKNVKITYHPNRKDYLTRKQGLITIDAVGLAPRKHLKRVIDSQTHTITYTQYIYQTSKLPRIVLHQDLATILDTEHLYIYNMDDTWYITSKQPITEHITTKEETLIESLEKHNIIRDDSEKISFKLYLKEKDPTNKQYPKITMKIIVSQFD